ARRCGQSDGRPAVVAGRGRPVMGGPREDASASRAPRLLVKTLAITFITVAALLVVVFAVVWLTVRNQVRDSVTSNLESSQRIFAALETRRQRELAGQASTLAESPTLKAALDTYQVETRGNAAIARPDLLETIDREMAKVAARIDSDALVLADMRRNTIASAGRLADRWPRGRPVALTGASDTGASTYDGIARMGDSVFRVVAVPLTLDDGSTIGTLFLATSLDDAYAKQVASISGTAIAVVSDGLVIASTLRPNAARDFEAAAGRTKQISDTTLLDREQFAYRRLVSIGDTSLYALGSIDESSRSAQREAISSLATIAAVAMALALVASFWIARLLTKPIGSLSTSLGAMTHSHDVSGRVPLTGSSREVDALATTFNELMASVAQAEAQTEAAYTGAIRALATALDARDPYTAGHSERVSVLSVAIGRSLALSADDLEVLRLGALLHDIGKIGVPDHVLMKPGSLTDAEFNAIKQHPVVGALANALPGVVSETGHVVLEQPA